MGGFPDPTVALGWVHVDPYSKPTLRPDPDPRWCPAFPKTSERLRRGWHMELGGAPRGK